MGSGSVGRALQRRAGNFFVTAHDAARYARRARCSPDLFAGSSATHSEIQPKAWSLPLDLTTRLGCCRFMTECANHRRHSFLVRVRSM